MSSNGWEIYKLKSLCTKIGSGATPRGGKETYLEEGPYALIRSQNVLDFFFSYDGLAFIDENQANQLSNVEIQERDVLLNITGDSVARVCQVPKTLLPARVNQHVSIIRADDTKLLPEYLKYFLLNPKFKSYLLGLASVGATRNALTKGMIEDLDIDVPPLPTQRRIADILSALDEKIELNRQTNATLEAIAQSIFREWFVVNEDSEKWQEIDLPEAIDFLEGPGIRNWQYTNSDEGIRFINIRCIQNRDINTETANRINENDVNTKYQHFLLRQDDVVVSTSGTLGRFGIIRDEHLPLLLNTSVIRMRPVEGVTTWSYLIGYIESEEFQYELATRATGSVQKNFGPMHLKQMKIKIPPIELLNEFEKVAEPLHRKMLHNFSESATLASLRDALLPKLMSGEVILNAVS